MKSKKFFLTAVIPVFLLTCAIGLIFILPIPARDFMFGHTSVFVRPPAPHLVYPINDEVTLSGDYLEFKWWTTFWGIDRYEFRLYKGYNMYKDALMLKKILPFNVGSLKLESNLFEDGQVYTWSLIQVADTGEKSEKGFISFHVSKK